MDAAALFAMIQSRRSIRRYEDRPVPRTVLQHLLEAAQWGPSAHNRQPWRFAVLVDEGHKVDLASAMGARFRADLVADDLPDDQVERQVARSYARLTEAPALIMLFVSMADMDHYPDPLRQAAERTMAVQSVALAAQNLLLMAHAEGLGTCWICAPLFCPDVVRDVLSLPADWEAQGVITVGYPAEQRTKTREPLDTKSRWY
jgi:coenzyme F420-0:L-glutamate ligase / coenzyme F420-1:gamma-L-glutamate ligase